MKLYAVYVITKDGRELISQIYQSPDHITNNVILSSFLAAFQSMGENLTKSGGAEKLHLSDMVYHLRYFGNFEVVAVTDDDEVPSEVLDGIGYRFLQRFGVDLLDWRGNQTMFEDFRLVIDEIVMKYTNIDISGSVNPTKPLNTIAIFELPKEIQSTALAITMFEYATIEQIIGETKLDPEMVEQYITKLRKDGYIGITERDGQRLYFATA